MFDNGGSIGGVYAYAASYDNHLFAGGALVTGMFRKGGQAVLARNPPNLLPEGEPHSDSYDVMQRQASGAGQKQVMSGRFRLMIVRCMTADTDC